MPTAEHSRQSFREGFTRMLRTMGGIILSTPRGANEEDNQRALTAQVHKLQTTPCGGCTFCCTAPGIPEEATGGVIPAKPACSRCVHAEGGCAIYDRRPEVCKGYLCFYAAGVVPQRPDVLGVAWSFTPVEHEGMHGVCIIGHCLDVDDAYDRTEVRDLIRWMLEANDIMGVSIRSDSQCAIFLPDGRTLKPLGRVDGGGNARMVTEELVETDEWLNPLVGAAIREMELNRRAAR